MKAQRAQRLLDKKSRDEPVASPLRPWRERKNCNRGGKPSKCHTRFNRLQ